MTQDIIAMARAAGFSVYREISSVDGSIANLKHVAALVRADEREACAKVCEGIFMWSYDDPGETAAEAIRARGQA